MPIETNKRLTVLLENQMLDKLWLNKNFSKNYKNYGGKETVTRKDEFFSFKLCLI